jgi:hypothetical protein
MYIVEAQVKTASEEDVGEGRGWRSGGLETVPNTVQCTQHNTRVHKFCQVLSTQCTSFAKHLPCMHLQCTRFAKHLIQCTRFKQALKCKCLHCAWSQDNHVY